MSNQNSDRYTLPLNERPDRELEAPLQRELGPLDKKLLSAEHKALMFLTYKGSIDKRFFTLKQIARRTGKRSLKKALDKLAKNAQIQHAVVDGEDVWRLTVVSHLDEHEAMLRLLPQSSRQANEE